MIRVAAVAACLLLAAPSSAAKPKKKAKRAPAKAASAKTAPAKPSPAGPVTVRGEATNTDVLNNTITVRSESGSRDFTVGETASIKRAAGDKPAAAISLEEILVGDAVEVSSPDGKAASEILVRSPR